MAYIQCFRPLQAAAQDYTAVALVRDSKQHRRRPIASVLFDLDMRLKYDEIV